MLQPPCTSTTAVQVGEKGRVPLLHHSLLKWWKVAFDQGVSGISGVHSHKKALKAHLFVMHYQISKYSVCHTRCSVGIMITLWMVFVVGFSAPFPHGTSITLIVIIYCAIAGPLHRLCCCCCCCWQLCFGFLCNLVLLWSTSTWSPNEMGCSWNVCYYYYYLLLLLWCPEAV